MKKALELGSVCKECGHCCSYGAGWMLKKDVECAAKHLRMTEERFIEKYCDEHELFNTKLHRPKLVKQKGKEIMPYGRCIFLKNNKCSIHEAKPLHCRIGNCSEHGNDLHVYFIVNHLVNPNDPQSVRDYDSYIKTGGKVIPGASLKDIVPQTKKRKAILEQFKGKTKNGKTKHQTKCK